VGSARTAFDAAVTAHLGAAALLRGARADAREDNVQVRQLHERLTTQAARLGAAATQLGLPAPRLSAESSAPATPDVAAALGQAETALRQADTELDKALQAITMPMLMPQASPGLRAAVVYGGFAIVAWLFHYTLLAAVDYEVVTTVSSLCGLPLLAFGAGLLTLQTLGQPRTGERIAYSPKLGAVICFGGLPLLWLILLVALTAAK
jgi:hypothetical protein